MKKFFFLYTLIFILLFGVNYKLLAQNIYFNPPTSGQQYQITQQGGSVGITYHMYSAAGWYIYWYQARLKYPNGTYSNWMEGQNGGWWVTEAGTYMIEGKAYGTFAPTGWSGMLYRDPFSIYVIYNYPVPLTATISGPDYLADGELGTWTVNASGGTSPYSYSWSYYVYCNDVQLAKTQPSESDIIITPNAVPCGYWFTSSITTNTFSRRGDTRSFIVKCVVRDASNSTVTVTQEVSSGVPLPKYQAVNDNAVVKEFKTELLDNYPNPFNPSTKISYSLKTEGRVSLKIYNTLGEEVIKLVDEIKPAGSYEVVFNAAELPSGIYIYRMQSGEYISSKKMLLIK